MRILIVNAGKSKSRFNELNSIIVAAFNSVEVGFCLKSIKNNELMEDIKTTGIYDLILHHCGDSNAEYIIFENKYRELCPTKEAQCPLIVFFSGGGIRDVQTYYEHQPDICVVSYSDLIFNLREFLKTPDTNGKFQLNLLQTKSPVKMSLLSGLSILCVGYLLVHAGPDGCVEVEDPSSKIAKALQHIEWAKALKSKAILRNLDPRLANSRDAMRTKVMDPSNWVIGQVAKFVVVTKIKNNQSVEPASMVAEAYLEITEKILSS